MHYLFAVLFEIFIYGFCFFILSACCKPGTVARRDVKECSCVYPVSLALTLLNVSFVSNWSVEFQKELAFQLGLKDSQMEISSFNVFGLSQVNISMDIAPLVGISFSVREVYTMNYTLSMHKVHFDPSIASDYKLVNFTWFKPPPHPPGNIWFICYDFIFHSLSPS